MLNTILRDNCHIMNLNHTHKTIFEPSEFDDDLFNVRVPSYVIGAAEHSSNPAEFLIACEPIISMKIPLDNVIMMKFTPRRRRVFPRYECYMNHHYEVVLSLISCVHTTYTYVVYDNDDTTIRNAIDAMGLNTIHERCFMDRTIRCIGSMNVRQIFVPVAIFGRDRRKDSGVLRADVVSLPLVDIRQLVDAVGLGALLCK